MSIRKVPLALAAVTLAVAPLAVQAAPVELAAAPTADESQIGGSVLWIAAAIAIIVGLVFLLKNDNDPVSP